VDFPDQVDVLVHDPWRPVPALGGHAGVPAGSFDRGGLDCRTDVLTFTTDPLTAPLQVAGTCVARFYCRADAPSFDISAILSEVLPDGRVMNLTQGQICIAPPAGEPPRTPQPASAREAGTDPPRLVEVPLQPTYFTLAAGHALRLSIAAACFPAYAVNPGTGTPAGHSRLIEQRLITLQVLHGQSYPSCLELPLSASTALP